MIGIDLIGFVLPSEAFVRSTASSSSSITP
jgi:hypothetical protein